MIADMADCGAMLSCSHVLLRGSRVRTNICIPRSVDLKLSQRECLFFGKTYVHCRLSLLKAQAVLAPFCTTIRGNRRPKKRHLSCCCLGALMDPENIAPSTLASYVDEALLAVSVIFTYMAGAIPRKRAILSARSNDAEQSCVDSSSIPYGRSLKNDTDGKLRDSWSEVEGKLLDALNANEHYDSVGGKVVESETRRKTCPLSLLALAEGPRLRLLSATLRQLQNEVSDISVSDEVTNQDVCLGVASKVIKVSIQPACSKWLEEEVNLEIGDTYMDCKKLMNRISEKLNGDDTVLQNIERSGKAELYADLLFFLRFGSPRRATCYDSKFLTRHAVDVLEDMVIMLADGIASIYLELISVDSNMSTEINSMGVTLCNLSTRELQRLRNEAKT